MSIFPQQRIGEWRNAIGRNIIESTYVRSELPSAGFMGIARDVLYTPRSTRRRLLVRRNCRICLLKKIGSVLDGWLVTIEVDEKASVMKD